MQPNQNNNIPTQPPIPPQTPLPLPQPPQTPQPEVISGMYTPGSTTVNYDMPAVANTTQPTPAIIPVQPIQPVPIVEPINVSDQPDIQPFPDDELIDDSDQPIQSLAEDEPVYWSAKEYIHQEKNGLWFVVFGLVIVAFIALDIFVIQSFFYSFSILIVVMAVAVIIYSRRPPRTIDYTLSGDQGLYVGDRLYHFSEFKAFGLVRDQGEHSIMMIPVKRFSPGLTVYFPEEAGEKIVDIFGARLPMQDLKLDAIDVIVRKLRL
jgi:hypothetical protein